MTAEFKPTDEQRKTVRAMAAYGVPQDDICLVIGISKPTLHKAFRHELDTAMAEANAKVAQTLFNLATKHNNVSAAIFWLKARAKWRENDPPEQDPDKSVVIKGGLPD